MNKIYYLVFTFIFLSVITVQAQTQGSISGKLIDEETQEPVPLANVRVLQSTDSTFVTGKASDTEGNFNIPVQNGSYILHISFIGYNDTYQNVNITSSSRNVNIGTITVGSDNILLSETVVTAKVPEIAVKGDTLEYNADSYKVTESAVVEDLLKQKSDFRQTTLIIPGVRPKAFLRKTFVENGFSGMLPQMKTIEEFLEGSVKQEDKISSDKKNKIRIIF